MRLFENTNIDFLGKRKKFYIVSLIVIIVGMATLFVKGIPLGIDFVGGTELQVRFQTPVNVSELRDAMDREGLPGMEIKTMDTENDVLLRTPLQGEGQTVAENIQTAIKKNFPGDNFEVLRVDKVGPKIGEELRRNALFAIIFSLLGILIYLSLRFQFIYAIGAVAALFHDVLITISAIAICNAVLPLRLEFDQPMLAAFLTLIGFSVNDTVVIFDRIRENIRLFKNEEIESVMNKSVNATLSRTIITSGTVFLTVLVIFIFGGEVLRGFSFTFMVGIITGTYSSIFVASAVVVDWKHRLDKSKASTKGKRLAARTK
ncbi:MAG: protein translocase subunit SecF [Ignavibacteriae bacterium]|nr:protein translocase subunit SecF [Ignavibacteriota bacterium]MCB9242818.1 protein translocase subunit SecF [Ignavibacteriales bacterium]